MLTPSEQRELLDRIDTMLTDGEHEEAVETLAEALDLVVDFV